MVLQLIEKGFRFSEKSFQSSSIEKVQNFQWLPHKNMPISQTEDYFEKTLVPAFRRSYRIDALSVGFKLKPLRKNVFLC